MATKSTTPSKPTPAPIYGPVKPTPAPTPVYGPVKPTPAPLPPIIGPVQTKAPATPVKPVTPVKAPVTPVKTPTPLPAIKTPIATPAPVYGPPAPKNTSPGGSSSSGGGGGGSSPSSPSPYVNLPQSSGGSSGGATGISDLYARSGGALPIGIQERLSNPVFASAHGKAGFKDGEYKGTKEQNMRLMPYLSQDELSKHFKGTTPAPAVAPTAVGTDPLAPTLPVTPAGAPITPAAPTAPVAQEQSYNNPELNGVGKSNDRYMDAINQYLPQVESPDAIKQRMFDQSMNMLGARQGVRKGLIDEINRKGKIRLGQAIANQANSGMLGSTIGSAAQIEAENQTTQDLQQETNNANAEIVSLQNNYANQTSDAVYKSLNNIQQAYTMRGDRETANAASIFSVLANNGKDITKLGIQDLNQLSQQTGISVQAMSTAYAAFIQSTKAEAALNKKNNPGFDLNPGQSRYEMNKETGKYEEVASVAPKAQEQTADMRKAERDNYDQATSRIERSQEVRSLIDDISTRLSHGDGSVGFFSLVMNSVPGTPGYDLKQQVNRLKSIISLDQIKNFKGTGPMSDTEFKTASQAGTSLSLGGSQEQFKAEMNRIYDAMKTSDMNMNRVLQGGAQYGAPQTQAPAGSSNSGALDWNSI